MLGYFAIKFFSALMCVSPLCVRKFVAWFVSSVAVLVVPKWRMQMAEANISECLGVDAARAKQIAEASLRRFGRMAVEVLCFPNLNEKNIREKVRLEGQEYLEAAYAQGRGVIIATGHYGNWELLGATVSLLGYPLLSIARKQNNSYMDKAINEFRTMVGQQIAYNRGERDLLSISRMLRDKKILGVLFDQDTNRDGVHLNLFGKESRIPFGAAALSRIYSSPIVPIFLHNNADGTCTAKIYPPLYTARTKDKEKDFYEVTRQLVIILEQEIIAQPEMWFWVHDRWKDGRKKFRQK